MTAAEAIKSLLTNRIFLSTVSSLIIAQIFKLFFFLLKKKNRSKRKWDAIETVLWRTGGMPSSHSACVCALATSIGILESITSTYFIISLVFAMVVLRDSVGVRRTAGLQARALNNLGKQSAKLTGLEFHSIKEINGHTPLEVLVGSLLGILIAVCFSLL